MSVEEASAAQNTATSSALQAYKKMDDPTNAAPQSHFGQDVAQEINKEDAREIADDKKSKKCRKPKHKKGKKRTQICKDDSSSSSSSDSESEESDQSTSDSESSVDEKHRRRSDHKRRGKQRKSKLESDSSDSETWQAKSKRRSRRRRDALDHSSSDCESTDDRRSRRKRGEKPARTASPLEGSDAESDESLSVLREQQALLNTKIELKEAREARARTARSRRDRSHKTKRRSGRKSESPDFKRVDQLWDSSIHNYKLKESAEDDDSEFSEYAFLVRRRFDWENKYLCTVVDIKSKDLKDALTVIMKDCKSVSLDAEEPTIDPNILFLYVEKIRAYRKTIKAQLKKEKKRKVTKKLESQRSILKTLVKYIDTDYADTKKTLYPLIAAGNITFDLIWALWSPGEIAITSTYGVWDEPRCFKADYANKYSSLSRGEWYSVEGKYLEYDGKAFGFGDFEADIEMFKGPRKINSLAVYPLKYHKDEAGIKKQIIARGKRFVDTEGMNYKFHKGLAFMKKKKQVLKININGRVMVDPATFRRINPNYQVSTIKAKDADDLFSECESEEEECSCCSSDDERPAKQEQLEHKASDLDEPKVMYKYVKDEDGCYNKVSVEVDENGDPLRNQQVEQLTKKTTFSDEDLLLTSSVVLGFAFSEKLWLEFTFSGVSEIEYNEKAFESLVLPPNQKSIVKALVESHKFNAAKTIDDVVQGKGKGLVAVLHGPPGTGKTLTAEGISELLRCPLYMVSAGELGTDPARLEVELQKILDIAHSWGAVLLLDEADVFLEKRQVTDIHRNALTSIFLRLLEYFQGILFLTTNRVETFDDAFQSRIHVALRYGDLTTKAKKAVWKMFLEMCRTSGGCPVADFTEQDLDTLSRHTLNGRQIKNTVRTAQALALNENETLTMLHIKKVLDVAESFERDLKGGTGYVDAMRSYT